MLNTHHFQKLVLDMCHFGPYTCQYIMTMIYLIFKLIIRKLFGKYNQKKIINQADEQTHLPFFVSTEYKLLIFQKYRACTKQLRKGICSIFKKGGSKNGPIRNRSLNTDTKTFKVYNLFIIPPKKN